MELAPSGVPLSFEVTFDTASLPVAMSVYDDTGSSPVLISGPTAMLNFFNTTYRGKFMALQGKNYLVIKAVYTDGTFATLDPNYSQGSEAVVAENIAGGASATCEVLGFVTNPQVIGLVQC